MQETWINRTEVLEEKGFFMILSGSGDVERSWAGVGFIVAPWCRRRMKSYKQVNDRIAYVKLKVLGGVVGILTAYAPHNLKPLAERHDFYVQLDAVYRSCAGNKGRYILRDFNARIGPSLPG